MNTKNVTITDVAKEAGLSIATVSRVINHARNVDPESEKTIRKAMQKLGYVPAVKKQKFSVMALIVPSLENHFFSSVVEGVMRQANQAGCHVALYSANGSAEQEVRCLVQASSLGVSSLLFCPLSDTSSLVLANLFPPDFPLLIVYRRDYLKGASHIYYNNVEGGYLAAKYLLRGNHRHIAFFASFWQRPSESMERMLAYLDQQNRGSYSSLDRLEGYRRALSEFSLPLDPSLICMTGYDFSSGYATAKEFLSRLRDFDAVICCNDAVAAGVLQALDEQHIAVPQQVSILGYDDSFLSEISRPSLSSIHQDPHMLGEKAFGQLEDIIGGKRCKDTVLQPSLKIRSSSRMRELP